MEQIEQKQTYKITFTYDDGNGNCLSNIDKSAVDSLIDQLKIIESQHIIFNSPVNAIIFFLESNIKIKTIEWHLE